MRISGVILNLVFIMAGSLVSVNANGQASVSDDSIKYFDAQSFVVIGRYHQENNFRRIPAQYRDSLRSEVWALSGNAAGISVRFRTNSPVIKVRWISSSEFIMDHMASTGISGVDLYALTDGRWRYVSTGRVRGRENECTLVQTHDSRYREYLLNLSLYNGVDSLLIGVSAGSEITVPKEGYLTGKKPVVYYGTSIAQGGCASRPGLAFTNILSRSLDRSFINMGFSGNGNCEKEVGEIMSTVDAALYVLDCNPNTAAEQVYERTVEVVKLLKQKRPDVPVLLVESIYFESILSGEVAQEPVRKNAELKRAYDDLIKDGVKGLYYKKGDGMIGNDHEATVDGIHPNDIGMLRMAEALEPVIRKIIR